MTQKIDNESAKRRLSPKTPTVQLVAAQPLPQQLFCDTHRLPQSARP
jgi:hypothetical protein